MWSTIGAGATFGAMVDTWTALLGAIPPMGPRGKTGSECASSNSHALNQCTFTYGQKIIDHRSANRPDPRIEASSDVDGATGPSAVARTLFP